MDRKGRSTIALPSLQQPAPRYSDYPRRSGAGAEGCYRVHSRRRSEAGELDIDRQSIGPSSLFAEVVHIAKTPMGVKVRLFNDDFGLALNVDLPEERANALGLKIDEHVYVFARKNSPNA